MFSPCHVVESKLSLVNSVIRRGKKLVSHHLVATLSDMLLCLRKLDNRPRSDITKQIAVNGVRYRKANKVGRLVFVDRPLATPSLMLLLHSAVHSFQAYRKVCPCKSCRFVYSVRTGLCLDVAYQALWTSAKQSYGVIKSDQRRDQTDKVE